jgi:hypothetical protein
MNDYLNNLIVRTLQQAPVVRPRLHSLFEPTSVAADHAVNASSLTEIIIEDQTTARPAPRVSQPLPLMESLAQQSEPAKFEAGRPTTTPQTTKPQTIEADSGEKLGSSRESISRRDEFRTPAAQILTPAPFQTTTPEARSIHNLTTKTAQPSSLKSGTDSTASEHEVYKLSNAPLKVGDHSPSGPLKVSDHSPADPLSPGRGDIVETTARRALASGVVRPAVRRDDARLFPAHDQVIPFRAPDPPPTINITIGRVDVRAVFTQPQAQPPRRAHPAPMSLDEYLKQQSEGRK